MSNQPQSAWSQNVNLRGKDGQFSNMSLGGDVNMQSAYRAHKVFPRLILSGATQQVGNCPTAGVLIRVDPTNSGPVFVGGLGDDAAYVNRNYPGDNHGHPLFPGDPPFLDPVTNANLVTFAGTKNDVVYVSCWLNQPTDVQLPTASPPQFLPPLLLSATPANGSTGIGDLGSTGFTGHFTSHFTQHFTLGSTGTGTSMTALFSQPLDPTTVNTTDPNSVSISPALANFSAAVDSVNPNQIDMSFPAGELVGNTLYTISFGTDIASASPNDFTNKTVQTTTFTTDAAPTITSSTPSNGAAGIGNISLATVVFNRPLVSGTVTTTNITSSPALPGMAVAIDPTNPNQVNIVWTGSSLSASTTYTITFKANGVRSTAGYVNTGDQNVSFTTAAAATITTSTPANGATNQILNVLINAVASRSIDATTLTGANITISPSVTLTYNIDQSNAAQIDINHAANLATNQTYTVTITTGVKDTLGFAIGAQFAWSFTTGTTATNIAPTVVKVVPSTNATGVNPLASSVVIQLVFSEAMDATTINNTNITLKQTVSNTNAPSAVTLAGDNVTVNIVPNSNLTSNLQYTITATTAVKSTVGLGGLNMAAQYTSNFTTEPNPTVFATNPVNGATGTDLAFHPTVTFSAAMNTGTLTTSNVFITGVTSTLSYSSDSQGRTIVTIIPNANLANNTTFTINAQTGCQQPDGLGLASNFTSVFTTANFAPAVTAVTPANGATSQAVAIAPTVTFSKKMNASTINNTNIFLSPSAPATLTLDSTGKIATITPTSNLSYSTTYTINVTTGCQENQYNIPLSGAYSSAFTTTANTPTVLSTTPANNANNILISVDQTVTFSIAMNSGTITSGTVYLTDVNNTVIPSVLTYNAGNNTATINPNNPLAYSTTYVIHATTGCQSSSNVPLASNFTSSFVTQALSYTSRYHEAEGNTGSGSLPHSYYLGTNDNGYFAFGEQADSTKAGQNMVGFIFTKVQIGAVNTHSGGSSHVLTGSYLNVEIRDSNGNLMYAFASTGKLALDSYTQNNTPADNPPAMIDSNNTYTMKSGDVLLVRWFNPPSGVDLEIGSGFYNSTPAFSKARFAKYSNSGNGTWTSYTSVNDDIAATMYSTP